MLAKLRGSASRGQLPHSVAPPLKAAAPKVWTVARDGEWFRGHSNYVATDGGVDFIFKKLKLLMKAIREPGQLASKLQGSVLPECTILSQGSDCVRWNPLSEYLQLRIGPFE